MLPTVEQDDGHTDSYRVPLAVISLKNRGKCTLSPPLQHSGGHGVLTPSPPWWLQPPSISSLSTSALPLHPGRLYGFGGTIQYVPIHEAPWGLRLRVLENAHLPSSRGMTLVCPARHQLTPAQDLCSRHTDSHSPQVPSKENLWNRFTKHLMSAYAKQQQNGHLQKMVAIKKDEILPSTSEIPTTRWWLFYSLYKSTETPTSPSPCPCQQARWDVFMYTHICLSSHDITETFRFALFIRYISKHFCQQGAASPP